MVLFNKFLDIINFFCMLSFADVPEYKQIGFQDSASPIMESIIRLHSTIFFYLIVVSFFVIFLNFVIFMSDRHIFFNMFGIEKPFFDRVDYDIRSPWSSFMVSFIDTLLLRRKKGETFDFYAQRGNMIFEDNFFFRKKLYSRWTHQAFLEVVWTLIPSLILVAIAIPSFVLLYSLDAGSSDPYSITVKVIGSQWYWSYQFPSTQAVDSNNLFSFDSYRVVEDLQENNFVRLLDSKPALWLPLNRYIRFIITSKDVIHSWAVPSLGIKVDAVPGRLNQAFVYIKRPGIFYGQCSEICGIYHGFMPIKIISQYTIK